MNENLNLSNILPIKNNLTDEQRLEINKLIGKREDFLTSNLFLDLLQL